MLRDDDLRSQVENMLFEVAPTFTLSDQWRGLDILIGQTSLKNPALGEAIDGSIASNKIDLGDATVWPARCVVELGATLTDGTLKRLDREDVSKGAPVEKFSLIARTAEAHHVAKVFEDIPRFTTLTENQASELIRIFKREAIKLNLDLNGPLSAFLDALPPDTALKVASNLKSSIGSTYEARSRLRGAASSLHSHGDFQNIMRGMEKITDKIQWSLEQAQNEHRTAA
jgi:hypothetical protein